MGAFRFFFVVWGGGAPCTLTLLVLPFEIVDLFSRNDPLMTFDPNKKDHNMKHKQSFLLTK